MNGPSVLIALTAHLALLSSISFGGFPTVLPDVRNFVVTTHGWMTDRDFANFFAMAQATPGPNMILMMSFVGWKVRGCQVPLRARLATFGATLRHVIHRVPPVGTVPRRAVATDRARWPRSVTIGLVIASGTVMARTADTEWQAAAVTVAAAVLTLMTRLKSPFWTLLAGGALGGLGLL